MTGWCDLQDLGGIHIVFLQIPAKMWMGPKQASGDDDVDLFRMELVNLIDRRHELVRLAKLVD